MKKNILKNVFYAVGANVISLGLSIILSFFIPKILGVEEYGYWQLYSLIISYAGFFHLGLIDGIYLKIGGKHYDELDKLLYSSVFKYMMIILFSCGILAIGIISTMPIPSNHRIVYVSSAVAIILVVAYTFFDTIMQATNRIKDSSRLMITFKIFYFILVIFLFLIGKKSFQGMIFADILSKCIVVLLSINLCSDLLKVRNADKNIVVCEMKEDLVSGINLMVANVAGMLVTGVMRFFVVAKWDIETFGNISIAIAISNLLFAFMSTLSVVFFPILRRLDTDTADKIYRPIRTVLVTLLIVLLCFYYPVKEMISWWLPQYEMGIRYMAILFPMVIFESKSTLLVNTYLKNYHMEKSIFKSNVLSVIVCIILSFTFSVLIKNLTLEVLSIIIVLFIKGLLLETFLGKRIKQSYIINNIGELIISLFFVFVMWNFNSLKGFCLYAMLILVLAIVFWKRIRKEFKDFYKMIRE